jgi:hypothetical protein
MHNYLWQSEIFFFLKIQKKSQKIQNAKWKKAEKKFESVAE